MNGYILIQILTQFFEKKIFVIILYCISKWKFLPYDALKHFSLENFLHHLIFSVLIFR